MGSMNFSMHPLAQRYKKWKFDWEESYLRESDSYIFSNTFRDIGMVAEEPGQSTASSSSTSAMTWDIYTT